jgi:uncharacterized membrane protein YraQ (UPF0718 family)
MKLFSAKPRNTCEVHGSSGHHVNKSLLFMVTATIGLIVWHVWSYGPTAGEADPATLPTSLLAQLAWEFWDILGNPHGILHELNEIAPYFLAGILLAGWLRTYKVAGKLHLLLRHYGVLSIFIASTIGIITPLCACGTVTTAVSLLFAGLPLAPVMSLMVSSSLLSPSTYLLTLNDLGPEWTVIRTIAAYSMGLIAGLTTYWLARHGFRTEDVFIEGAITIGDFHDEDYPDEKLRCNCRRKFGNRVARRTHNKFMIFLAKSVEMLWPVGKYILVGVAMGNIVERYVPSEWIYSLFGRRDPLNIVWITLASVPMFMHQISASSIIYHIKSSLPGTLDGGAALAFMIGGPVTAVPTMVLFWTIFKKRVFALYMVVCIVGTILVSFAFEWLVFVPGVDTGNTLLAGVSSLSGGSTPALRKEKPEVRMVLDPGGQGLVATYRDDRSGGGGIVFETNPRRILAAAPGPTDDARYVANVAEWLEQGSLSAVRGKILLYDQAGTDSHASLLALLKKNGYTVEEADRRTMATITPALLASYNQLWFLGGAADNPTPLSEGEGESIAAFTDGGGSILLVPGPCRPGEPGAPALNKLAGRYGVVFAGQAENREVLQTAIASNMFTRGSEIIGNLLKFVHKT